MSIILAWSQGAALPDEDEITDASSAEDKAAIAQRDDPQRLMKQRLSALDMGGTTLPSGAVPINAKPAGPSGKLGEKQGKAAH